MQPERHCVQLLAPAAATQAREISPVLLKSMYAYEPQILNTGGLALPYIADLFCVYK